MNVHFNAFYIGAGVGFSSEVRPGWKSDIDVVTNIGYEVFEAFNKKGSIFAELRYPIQDGLEFKHAHEILLGLRLLF